MHMYLSLKLLPGHATLQRLKENCLPLTLTDNMYTVTKNGGCVICTLWSFSSIRSTYDLVVLTDIQIALTSR